MPAITAAAPPEPLVPVRIFPLTVSTGTFTPAAVNATFGPVVGVRPGGEGLAGGETASDRNTRSAVVLIRARSRPTPETISTPCW